MGISYRPVVALLISRTHPLGNAFGEARLGHTRESRLARKPERGRRNMRARRWALLPASARGARHC